MVDGFAEVWPVVALEGAGDLIGDARPGFVAVEAGRRLAFANVAAGSVLTSTTWGAPLSVDDRLAERLVRFAARAEPGEEARELLRLSDTGRPTLRTVVFRRPIDTDDAVVVTVEGLRADPATATVEASLAPFVAAGGLIALFDSEGGVLGALGDHALVDGQETAIEAILDEADEIAVIERRLLADGRPLSLALVRLGDRPDARRLLWVAPTATSTVQCEPIVEPPAPMPLTAAATATEVLAEPEASPPFEDALLPVFTAAPSLAEPREVETETHDSALERAPETTLPVDDLTEEPAQAMAPRETSIDLADEDLFVAAPPLPLELFSDIESADADLDDAWSATIAPHAEPAPVVETMPHVLSESLEEAVRSIETSEVEATAPIEPPISAELFATDVDVDADVDAFESPNPTILGDAVPLPLAADALPLPLAAQPIETAEDVDADTDRIAPLVASKAAEDVIPLTTEAAVEPTSPEGAEPVAAPLESTEIATTSHFRFSQLDRSVKFVWQMDADHRFTMVSNELAGVVGPAAADLVGRRWSEVAADLDLDRDGTIAGALGRRDTWSGRTLLWPIEGEALRIPVDLAALPAFARGRAFTGFRGFGTCRADAPVPDPAGVGLRLAALGTGSPAAVPPTTVEPALAAPTPDEESEVACVVETLAEPPLYPGDGESATTEVDHPIEPAFAGDIGDDPIFHPERPLAQGDENDDHGLLAAPEPSATHADRTEAVEGGEPVSGEEIAPDAPSAALEALSGLDAPTGPEMPITEIQTPTIEPVLPREDTPSKSARVVALSGVAHMPTGKDPLSPPERQAFRQIAEALGARIEGEAGPSAPSLGTPHSRPAAGPLATPTRAATPLIDTRLLDRLPLALALMRDDTLLHANERFLSLLRYPDLDTLRAAGGVDALFAGSHVARRFEMATGRVTPLLARDGTVVPCEARLSTVPVEGGSVAMLTLAEHVAPAAAAVATPTPETTTSADHDRERIAELQAIVDTATDGVLILDGGGLVLSANTAAEVLFGVERRAMVGRPLTERLAPESRRSAMDYLDGLASNGVASVLNDGREVIGAVAPEGLIPLFMTIGRVSSGPVAKYCAVLRDITQWKKSEEDLTSARRRAEEASIHKSDFLAKISHEIRTPLNAIIGFSELMMDERFGPVGNDRYKDYLRDIHVSGSHIMSLVNDLLDLSKVEAGKMDLRFEAVPLADVVSECVAMMQPQANRERIIIRSSLPTGVPPVVADARSMRQVVLNLLSNAIKFTPAGGQVIVSITAEDNGEVILRVRDTGYGMSDKELQTALEPFRQLHTTRSRGGGTGLGLPLTKALTEANRAVFRIDSTVGQGTLVSIAFPVTRVLAS